MTPNIFNYLDYRHFLNDYFSLLKEKDRSFSLRSFAKMAGSTSPNFLQLIRDRKLNIQPSALHILAESFGLSVKERRFFELIVAFDHAKTHDEKDRYFRSIMVTREYREIKSLDKRQYEFFSHWYIPVIRELIVDTLCNGDPVAIGEMIVPPVLPAKVKKGIDILESLGLVVRTPDGTWAQSERSISTPSEVLSLAVTTYHKNVIALARESIERFDSTERDIRSVTLGISSAGYEEVKNRMEAFWKELLSFANTQETLDRVYQVNMQLFPLSKKTEKK